MEGIRSIRRTVMLGFGRFKSHAWVPAVLSDERPAGFFVGFAH